MAFTIRTLSGAGIAGIRTIDGRGIKVRIGNIIVDEDFDMNNFRIINLAEPVDNNDAVNKKYVDDRVAGLDPKESCRYVSVSNIADFNTKATVEAALDPVAATPPILAEGDRVLVKDQTTTQENGIYEWVAPSLVRAHDQDGTPGNEISGGNYTFVENGDTLAQTGWVVEGDGVLTIGVDPIIWFLFSANPAGNNLGGGAAIFRDVISQTFNFRTVTGSNSATVTQLANTVNVDVPVLSSAGGTTLVNDANNHVIKGLTAGTNISLTNGANSITINSTMGNTTLASAGGTSLVTDGTGPDLEIKGLTAGTNISLTNGASAITINNTMANTTLASAGGTSLVTDGTGPTLAIKGLTAGTGISLTNNANDIQINNTAASTDIMVATYELAAGTGGASFLAGVVTIIPLNTTRFNSGSVSRSGNTVTLSRTGIWSFNVSMVTDLTGGDRGRLMIYNNGFEVFRHNYQSDDGGGGGYCSYTTYLNVTSGDGFTIRHFSNDAGTLGLAIGSGPNTYASFSCRFEG